jgi:hypothetical protein
MIFATEPDRICLGATPPSRTHPAAASGILMCSTRSRDHRRPCGAVAGTCKNSAAGSESDPMRCFTTPSIFRDNCKQSKACRFLLTVAFRSSPSPDLSSSPPRCPVSGAGFPPCGGQRRLPNYLASKDRFARIRYKQFKHFFSVPFEDSCF